MKKLILLAAAVLLSVPSASFAQSVVVRVGPPPRVAEHPGPRPHRGWVWVDGHHRWDGRQYVWVSGYWAAPPRPHAVWVRAEWRHRRDGWVWIDGHWRY